MGGGGIQYLAFNVKNTQNLPQKICAAADLFPEKKIDILVNSAGVVAKHSFFELDEAEYDNIMDTNLKGTYFVCKYVSKYMIERGIKGHILNVASSSSVRPAWTPYQISKWGIRGFTLGLADILLPYGIIVNAIAPGPTATPMLGKNEGDYIYLDSCPAKRFAMPSELAKLAVFMVSDLGNMIVGDTVYMTGGSGLLDLKG